MDETALNQLPDLPQVAALRHVADALWRDPKVKALWLGGSFAAGGADVYSDVDLRVAVEAAALADYEQPDWQRLFGQARLGGVRVPFGEDALFHHLVLEDGTIFDLLVQTPGRDNHEAAVKVLACRDPALEQRLNGFASGAQPSTVPVPSADLRKMLIEYWLGSHKHRKPLHRGLDTLVIVGLQQEQLMLLRLWTARHAPDHAHGGRPTIHSLTPAIAAIQQAMGGEALALIGMPLRSRSEIIEAIEAYRDEVGRVGRQLAEAHGFEYPAQLEQVVRAAWARFLDEQRRAAITRDGT